MLDDLVEVIETLRQRIRDHRSELASNETRTRMALVDPLLTALGWDTSDPSLVIPEYQVSSGKADYGLRNAGPTPAAFIEAKRLDESLEFHREQMTRYSNMAGVKYAGLTNGDRWELYDVFTPASLDERRILNISILSDPIHESALKMLLLWRPNLQSGSIVLANEPVLSPKNKEATPSITNVDVHKDKPIVDDENYIPLPDLQVPHGDYLGHIAVRFPEKPAQWNHPVRHGDVWPDLLSVVVDWLYATNRLQDVEEMKFKRALKLANKGSAKEKQLRKPHPIEGTPFVNDRNNGRGAHADAIAMLEDCGVDPRSVFVERRG